MTGSEGGPVMDASLERQIHVAAHEAGERLDRLASAHCDALSRTRVQHLIEVGAIRLNDRPARAGATVRAGDVISVRLPPAAPSALTAEDIPLVVVYEDDALAVIDKPAGMVVHPAPGHPQGTLVNALLARYPEVRIGDALRPGIVHRLDRDTSGLLVIARNERALRQLQQQQQQRTMHKQYLALVEGQPAEPAGLIDAPIARHPTDRTRMAVVPGGREARTHWQVREALGDYTLLDVRLETGRTHQIRVHLSWRGRPVAGDPLYGARRPRAPLGLARQFLHAARLGFAHPDDGRAIVCQSPLPADLQAALERARHQAGALARSRGTPPPGADWLQR